MNPEVMNAGLYAAGAAATVWLARRAWNRLLLSRAKHRSLGGHARWARRIARLIPYYRYDEAEIFQVDDAPPAVVEKRRSAFARLHTEFVRRYPKSRAETAALAEGISDLRFVSAYRVPFQFSEYVRRHLSAGSVVSSSSGVTVTDLDGNRLFDLTGSYGVNLFGYDFYKDCMARGSARAAELGPVLGPYHPLIGYNVARLRAISGLDEVSFHMSGTEAVMQAVRLARYHTRRSHLVRFCGAYHGWWGEVQPGVGNPTTQRETYTLAELSPATLRVLETRIDIACVLVNPLQALHPNSGAPGDSSLVDSSRRAHFDKAAYTQWLRQLREVCTRRGIVFILDEVFLGFRLAPGGAQEYFGVRADMVTYGKTLGGGFPVGVLCGLTRFMARYRQDRPADICFARGTFNSHPYVMGAMYEFLQRLDTAPIRALYDGLETRWNARAASLNARLESEDLPVRVANLSSIWTVLYTRPSPYNWMLQYYLRLHDLALSWVGTGRLIFSLNYGDEEYAAVADRFVAAARTMRADGWWEHAPDLTNQQIRRRLLHELVAHRTGAIRLAPARQS